MIGHGELFEYLILIYVIHCTHRYNSYCSLRLVQCQSPLDSFFDDGSLCCCFFGMFGTFDGKTILTHAVFGALVIALIITSTWSGSWLGVLVDLQYLSAAFFRSLNIISILLCYLPCYFMEIILSQLGGILSSYCHCLCIYSCWFTIYWTGLCEGVLEVIVLQMCSLWAV